MEINYDFVPEYKSSEIKHKSDIVSYAGKLLEIVGSPAVVVYLDENNTPVVLETSHSFVNAFDFTMDTY